MRGLILDTAKAAIDPTQRSCLTWCGENRLASWRGKPLAIRVENGPECVCSTPMIWAERQGIALTCIQPGKPQQNACVQRYNRTVPHDWLDLYTFDAIEEVQEIATEG